MPLRAICNTGNVHAFEFNAQQWIAFRATYRNLNLRMPCCDSPAIPKTSSRGSYFFAHARKGECTTAPESAEHLFCKQLVAQAALKAGWTVHTEWRGNTPDGDEWIADVFCQRGNENIAFEIQVSPQTDAETTQRQEKYQASGVKGAWFYSSRIRQGQVAHNRNTPAFVLSSFEENQEPHILGFDTSLSEFVTGMLTKRLVWRIPKYNKPIRVEYIHDNCWSCHRPVKQVYGFLKNGEPEVDPWHERVFTVAIMSKALEAVTANVTNEDLLSEGLNPIGKTDEIRGKPTNWPYCNLCIRCQAPQNNFHISQKLQQAFYGNDGVDQLGLVAFDRETRGTGRWVLLPNVDGERS